MALADDLLEQAKHLDKRERWKPRQASLRRAVSTAYYALFHLLVSEAVANWRIAAQRPELARAFEHGRMKVASGRVAGMSATHGDPSVVVQLRSVAAAFVLLQRDRHAADYDTGARFARTQVMEKITFAEKAFAAWRRVRGESVAQDYLLSLLVRERP